MKSEREELAKCVLLRSLHDQRLTTVWSWVCVFGSVWSQSAEISVEQRFSAFSHINQVQVCYKSILPAHLFICLSLWGLNSGTTLCVVISLITRNSHHPFIVDDRWYCHLAEWMAWFLAVGEGATAGWWPAQRDLNWHQLFADPQRKHQQSDLWKWSHIGSSLRVAAVLGGRGIRSSNECSIQEKKYIWIS